MADTNTPVTFEEIETVNNATKIQDIIDGLNETIETLNTYLEDIYTRIETLEQ